MFCKEERETPEAKMSKAQKIQVLENKIKQLRAMANKGVNSTLVGAQLRETRRELDVLRRSVRR